LLLLQQLLSSARNVQAVTVHAHATAGWCSSHRSLQLPPLCRQRRLLCWQRCCRRSSAL
jgi:hypothetical protein